MMIKCSKFAALDVFVLPTSEAVAITGASNGLLAPFPAGIEPFDDPEIAAGVLIAGKLRDLDDALIGFMIEIDVVHGIDLINRRLDIDAIFVVGYD